MDAVEVKAPVEVVKMTKAEEWAREGRCVTCGKPIIRSVDGMGSTCKSHVGLLRRSADQLSAAPEGWLRMSKVCRAAEAAGLTTGSVVKASGGDACTGPLLAPLFRVVYVGRAKFMHPSVVTEGFELIRKDKVTPKPAEPVIAPKASAPVVKPSTVNATANALKKAVIKK
jgi:hypothetical protein